MRKQKAFSFIFVFVLFFTFTASAQFQIKAFADIETNDNKRFSLSSNEFIYGLGASYNYEIFRLETLITNRFFRGGISGIYTVNNAETIGLILGVDLDWRYGIRYQRAHECRNTSDTTFDLRTYGGIVAFPAKFIELRAGAHLYSFTNMFGAFMSARFFLEFKT